LKDFVIPAGLYHALFMIGVTASKSEEALAISQVFTKMHDHSFAGYVLKCPYVW